MARSVGCFVRLRVLVRGSEVAYHHRQTGMTRNVNNTLIVATLAVLVGLAACGRTGMWFTDPLLNPSAGGAGGAGGDGGAGADDPVVGGAGGTGGGTGGEGGTSPCGNDLDCDDQEFCTTDRCDAGTCVFGPKDEDLDGFTAEECGGTDCNDLNQNVHPGLPETCSDAADNDCNGVADCNDPACEFVPDCGCVPDPAGEDCDNGVDDDCDTTVDCNDADCIGTPICGCTANEVGLCQNGIDDDCDELLDCDDPDCAGTTTCLCQATPEFCSNDQDEDCDLLVDCADPDCFGAFECSCVPPGIPEICDNVGDDDCDMLVDCADPDCSSAPACDDCVPEICDDGQDNDCDDIIDCADEACAFAPNCAATQELCNNGLDDDNDQLTDCADPDCANNPLCVQQQSNCLTPKLIAGSGTYAGDTTGNIHEHKGSCGGGAGEALFYFVLTQPSHVVLDTIGTSFDSVIYVRHGSCESGSEVGCDDDSGGFQWSAKVDFTILYPGTFYVFVDGFTVDPVLGANEGPFVLNVVIDPDPAEVCADGIDNDGDVYVDCADPDCLAECGNCNAGQPPGPEFGVAACTDGQDNDCDGDIDCDDDDCSASDYFLTECCNGQDQNDNGIPDDFNCRCKDTSDCAGGQICYTHTVHACGIPCNNFFGLVCPAVAPGSYCNSVTGQCEF